MAGLAAAIPSTALADRPPLQGCRCTLSCPRSSLRSKLPPWRYSSAGCAPSGSPSGWMMLSSSLARAVHPRANRHRLQPLGRAGPQQLLTTRHRRVEPAVIVGRVEDHRHAVVQLGHERVGRAGDDRAGLDHLARGPVLPALPQARKADGLAIPAPDQVGLLGSPALPLPLVEARCRHDAAAGAERGAEGRLVGHAFRAGVDHPVADGRVLGPGGDQAPADGDQLALAALALAHDLQLAPGPVAHDRHDAAWVRCSSGAQARAGSGRTLPRRRARSASGRRGGGSGRTCGYPLRPNVARQAQGAVGRHSL